MPSAAHQAVYGLRVGAPHVALYGLRVGIEHAAIYSIPLAPARHAATYGNAPLAAAAHQAVYADAAAARAAHAVAYGDVPIAATTHQAVYADAEAAQAAHRASYGDRPTASATHAAGYAIRASAIATHVAAYAINTRALAAQTHRSRWALRPDTTLVSIDATPELTWNAQRARVIAASLSADEDSPIWLAEQIDLADLAIWQQIALGDTITLAIGAETWTLRVDGKGYADQHADARYSLSAISPLAWLGAPYAASIDLDNDSGAVSAQSMVTALLEPVGALDWQLPDWLIPRGALAMTDTTPLAAARAIVGAIGGLIESAPDGTPMARARHPVSVPDYASASVDAAFVSSQIFASSVSAAAYSGANRLIISNEQLLGDSAADRIEYTRSDDSDYAGTVRAWPQPARAVVLGHTGHPETEIIALGERLAEHTELIEFVAGEGSARYPVDVLDALTWQHASLGSLSISGAELSSAVTGQSLALITYRTRSHDWSVALQQDESVQFVLI